MNTEPYIGPQPYQRHILVALNLMAMGGSRHIYGGTVPDAVVAHRKGR